MKLNRIEKHIIYQLIVNEIINIDRKTPPEYADQLQKLEIKLSEYIKE